MSAYCPYCKKSLGDLGPVMDQLAENKMNGELFFQSVCCNQKIRAYSEVMKYFIEAADSLPGRQMIGTA
ncbi:hypothetical protein [Marinobacter sp. OP 3.4]|uniref:hypothetical protein n=1 Tax=Marinobacter sp. OP 3.4 TaxID=3076501 RepID=UPI002E1F069B